MSEDRNKIDTGSPEKINTLSDDEVVFYDSKKKYQSLEMDGVQKKKTTAPAVNRQVNTGKQKNQNKESGKSNISKKHCLIS